jgi:glutamyl-tRNA synthetase
MHDRGSSTVYRGGTPTVRTRFAPSPTGLMHIGGFRTIIFSWLLARHSDGQFLLRIEDTDQERAVPNAVTELLDGLQWIGIVPDEGPINGGQAGPYYQSQRLGIYHKYINELLEKGLVYRCFCTKERLQQLREDQQARHLPTTGYDRLCRRLSSEEVATKLEAGEEYVVRLKVSETGTTAYIEALRGELTFQNSTLEDVILLKRDGFPTYHFAATVDDHLMDITHVIRGEEWLPSAPLHVLIYRAFGWEVPALAHVPVVMGNDRKKLSKRHGAEPILYYRDQGFLPEAVINFLALLGWSYDDKTDIITIDQLIKSFSLDRVNTANAIFDLDRLRWMNGVYIRQLSIEELVERVIPYLEQPEAKGGLPDIVARPVDRNFLSHILTIDQERLKVLTDAAPLTSFFFIDELEYPSEWLIGKGFDVEQARNGLKVSREFLTNAPDFTHGPLEEAMRNLATELGVKPGPLFMGIRVAVTGRKETPPLFETIQILGRERTLERIDRAIAKLG